MKNGNAKTLHQPLDASPGRPAVTNDIGVGSAAGEPIHVSSTSSQFCALDAELSARARFDAGRVDAIKQAISDGKFRLNLRAIADKLLASADGFFKKPH